jgi:beta-aspartyl-peptidase (threonine type)
MGERSSRSLVVHGGAWDIPDDAVEDHRRGVEAALRTGWGILEAGGEAMDAVEAAVRALEDDPTFDAGRGSMLNLDGEVELDAMIMRGDDMQAGAVAAVRNIRNPVSLARRLLERGEHVLLVGSGANRFAREQGIAEVPPEELLVGRELERLAEIRAGRGRPIPDTFGGPARGTVGAVALDGRGRLAAATSTGGTPGKYPGRVGDSPIPGCGCYCDGRAGGASATGYGEAILRATLCRDAVRLLEEGRPAAAAADDAIARLGLRFGGRAGIILVDRAGRIGHAHSTPRMAVAGRRDGEPPFASC